MNNCVFIGNVTKDIEVKQTSNGKSVAKFNLAVNSGYGENRHTDFLNMVAWGKTAENLAKYTSKGTKIAVTTFAKTSDYTNNDGKKIHVVEFWIEKFEFIVPKNSVNQQNADTPSMPPMPNGNTDGFMNIPDDLGMPPMFQ